MIITFVNLIDFLARILISAVFIFSGVNKYLNYDTTIQWMEGYGLPGIFLIPAIIFEILLPILLIIGYKSKAAAFLLFLFCIVTAFIFHFDYSNQIQVISFLKNIGLAGGLLFLILNGTKGWALERKKKYVRM
tara:strand:+ start:62 stop:460 length:399 start_codon:yes stop_codon:yes gene_type:complete